MIAVAVLILLPVVALGAPGRAAREGFVERFNEMAASSDFPFLLKLGKPDTTLSVVVTKGQCTRALLAKIVETDQGHIRNVGFTLVACSSDESISVKA